MNMSTLLSFFFPSRCLLCGDTDNLPTDTFLCCACAADIKPNINACAYCAEPVSEWVQQGPRVCARCLSEPPVYDLCWSPFVYAQPLEWMIQQLKFAEKLTFAPLLSRLMMTHLPLPYLALSHLALPHLTPSHLTQTHPTSSHYPQHLPDAIIPMPLHNKRVKQRGFNQSQMLAEPLAALLAVPIDMSSARRVRNTEHQTGKNARQRQLNMKGAFTFDNKHDYQHVVIFDDVITTGSSVTEFCKTIKRAGVPRVDVWSLARAERIR